MTQADIERHIGIISVHVKTTVLARCVSNNERMVVVKLGNFLREQATSKGPQKVLLKSCYHGFHANLIHNDTIVVHRVGSAHSYVLYCSNLVKVCDFFIEQSQKVLTEAWE